MRSFSKKQFAEQSSFDFYYLAQSEDTLRSGGIPIFMNVYCFHEHFGQRGAEAVPSADVFNRISKALEVSPDYLLNGTIQDKAKNNIQDSELLLQFEKIEKLNDQKKSLVKEFLDAFILKANLQQQLS